MIYLVNFNKKTLKLSFKMIFHLFIILKIIFLFLRMNEWIIYLIDLKNLNIISYIKIF